MRYSFKFKTRLPEIIRISTSEEKTVSPEKTKERVIFHAALKFLIEDHVRMGASHRKHKNNNYLETSYRVSYSGTVEK